jgi:hypothetical protein
MSAHRKDFTTAKLLYEAGLSIQDIAKYYSVSRQSMWDALKRRDVVFRPKIRCGSDNVFKRHGDISDGRCHDLFEKALEKRIIIRKTTCDVCGMVNDRDKSYIEAHHSDYSKPLDVMWLCRRCHYQWHKTNKALNTK